MNIVSLKLDDPLFKKIEGYADENDTSRSEAIRVLLEMAFAMLESEEDKPTGMNEEIMMMNIDMWLIQAQLYHLYDRDDEGINELKSDLSSQFRSIFLKKFPGISERFQDYISVKKVK